MTDKLNLDTYCSNAFGGFDHRVSNICCEVLIPGQKNITFHNLINSPAVVNIQENILKGIKSVECNRCWDDEKTGITSLRQYALFQDDNPTLEQLYDIYNKQIVGKKIKNLVINSGINCNLACRTCGSWSSSSHWIEDEWKHKKLFPNEKYTGARYTQSLLEDVCNEDFSSVEKVSIMGGEPFLNLNHLKILEKIISDGNSLNCTLYYTSNGTVEIYGKIHDTLKKFKKVHITLSLDATKEQFYYIRTTGSWDAVLNNIKFLRESNISFNTHTVISALNILYLDPVIELVQELKIEPAWVFCEYPLHYSLQIFNDKEKHNIIEYLQQINFNLSFLVDYIKTVNYSSSMRNKFFEEINLTKEFRNLNINDYLPKLTALLKE